MNPLSAVFPKSILAHLDEVERRIQTKAESREPSLGQWTSEPLSAGGKRIRPLLTLTAFYACAPEPTDKQLDQALDAAVALELIHTASLVHDDIMDEAKERRGKPSTYAAHGIEGAILVGDYLFTQAFALASTLPAAALEMVADACRRLCEGQLREQSFQASGSTDRSTYLSVIRDKTSALLSAACGIGAIVAGSPQTQIDAMFRYGDAIGNAFQVLDDVLDVAGDPRWTGKPTGTDYLAGTMSSPFINYVEQGGELPADRRKEYFPEVRQKLLESGSVATSQMEAGVHTQAALLELENAEESPAKAALATLAEFLMERAN